MTEKIFLALGIRRGKTEAKILKAIQELKDHNKELLRANTELRAKEGEVSGRTWQLRHRLEGFYKNLNRVREAFSLPLLNSENLEVLPTPEEIDDTVRPLIKAHASVALSKALPEVFRKLREFDSPVSVLLTSGNFGYKAQIVQLQTQPDFNPSMRWALYRDHPETGSKNIVILRTGSSCLNVEEALLSACSI